VSAHTSSEAIHINETLALLPLPALTNLTEPQVRGQACVWDSIPLTPDTAVNLGPRRMKRLDGHFDWFPRGCKRCTGVAALRTLHDHAPLCEQCVDNPDVCQVGLILRRLIRDGGRDRSNSSPVAVVTDLVDRLAGVVLPCQPCATAKILRLPGGHGCTGVAAMQEGRACPCCGGEGGG
jgi:hypothetical protein